MRELVSIVETPAFQREVSRVLAEDELDTLKDFLAANPEAGVVVPNSSGVRKLRWAASGRGKRGGARVIYYFHSMDAPLFLISIFTKNSEVGPRRGRIEGCEAVRRVHRSGT